MKKKMLGALVVLVVALGLGLVVLSGRATTSHQSEPATLGKPRSSAELVGLLSTPGQVELETIASADWAVDRSGLVNLASPTAKAAGLQDGDEPIRIFFHVLRHPTQGTFIVDTGVEKALRDAPEQSAVSGLVRSAMHMEKLKVKAPLGEWVAKEQLRGVFLTHLHVDHITGMRDVPNDVPVYTGPGEASATGLMSAIVRSTTDRALEGKGTLREWQFGKDGVLDVFGDGSVWALWVPGHTPGSTAYLVRTPRGPVLLTGDASHTRWGWEHHVEPGSFTADAKQGRESFGKLQAFVAAHPEVQVRLGHQD